MNRHEFNLEIISNQYRRNVPVIQAYEILSNLILKNNSDDLENLLRNHKYLPIWDENQIVDRDNIDFLIDYYSILEIGILADYFPDHLPTELKNEIEFILGNDYVKKYYVDYYPLLLPQMLLKKSFFSTHNVDDSFSLEKNNLFEKFLILNQTIKKDNDVDMFLWLLDDGSIEGFSIINLYSIFINSGPIHHKHEQNDNPFLNSSLLGFIKYTQFLNDYVDLLKQSGNFKLLQSAFWHYQSYWFEHMSEKLGNILSLALAYIHGMTDNTRKEELFKNTNSYIIDNECFKQWKQSSEQFESIERNIQFLFDKKLGNPIKQFLNDTYNEDYRYGEQGRTYDHGEYGEQST